MFITPMPMAPHFEGRKKAPVKAEQPTQATEAKKASVPRAVETQLKLIAKQFNKNLDIIKDEYRAYANMKDENGLQQFSESEMVRMVRDNNDPNSPKMTTMALNENGRSYPDPNKKYTQALHETGRSHADPGRMYTQALNENG